MSLRPWPLPARVPGSAFFLGAWWEGCSGICAAWTAVCGVPSGPLHECATSPSHWLLQLASATHKGKLPVTVGKPLQVGVRARHPLCLTSLALPFLELQLSCPHSWQQEEKVTEISS